MRAQARTKAIAESKRQEIERADVLARWEQGLELKERALIGRELRMIGQARKKEATKPH